MNLARVGPPILRLKAHGAFMNYDWLAYGVIGAVVVLWFFVAPRFGVG